MKGMALGEGLDDRDVASVQVEEGVILMADSFTHLGLRTEIAWTIIILSTIIHIKSRIAKASRAFRFFRAVSISVDTKKQYTILAVQCTDVTFYGFVVK